MANTYTIKITNEDKWHEYFRYHIYQAPINCKAALYVDFYQSGKIGALETGTVTIIPEPYAVVSTAPVEMDEPERPMPIRALQSRPVRLTKRPVKGSVVKIDCNADPVGKTPFFDDAAAGTTTMDKSFRISTSANVVNAPDEIIVMGMGLKHPETEEIVPVALCHAIPSGTLTFTPEMDVYYIVPGYYYYYESGFRSMDEMTYSSESDIAEIDFRGKPPGTEIAVTRKRNQEGNDYWVIH